jgi:hypothetical protein
MFHRNKNPINNNRKPQKKASSSNRLVETYFRIHTKQLDKNCLPQMVDHCIMPNLRPLGKHEGTKTDVTGQRSIQVQHNSSRHRRRQDRSTSSTRSSLLTMQFRRENLGHHQQGRSLMLGNNTMINTGKSGFGSKMRTAQDLHSSKNNPNHQRKNNLTRQKRCLLHAS